MSECIEGIHVFVEETFGAARRCQCGRSKRPKWACPPRSARARLRRTEGHLRDARRALDEARGAAELREVEHRVVLQQQRESILRSVGRYPLATGPETPCQTKRREQGWCHAYADEPGCNLYEPAREWWDRREPAPGVTVIGFDGQT